MSDFGYFTARVYTSRGEIPIKDASVVIENFDSSAVLGARVTDSNGKITPVVINTPPLADSQSPGVENPFATVNVRISHPGFYTQYIRNAQVFEGETSLAEAELIPIDYTLDFPLRIEDFTVTPQNL